MAETFGRALRRLREQAGLSQPQLARQVPISQASLSRYESDRQQCDPTTADRLDTLLGADGALRASCKCKPAPIAVEAVLAFERDRPVDIHYVNGLRESAQNLISLDGLHGGGDLAPIAARAFNEAHLKLSSGHYLPETERDLEAVTAELGEIAGWLLYDADHQARSREINLEALNLSRFAGDRSMELFILTNMSMQSLHTSRPREALQIAQAVMDWHRLPPRVATLLSVRKARALACLGDHPSAIAEMKRAQSALDDSIQANDPFWTWWVTECELGWHAGMMHASIGDWSAAIDWFGASLELGKNGEHKRRGIYVHSAYLLDALVRSKSWTQVEAVALDVLSLAGEIASGRVTPVLRNTKTTALSLGVPSSVGDILTAIEYKLTA